ncbi:uncharacterized protein LOC121052873 [Rosa chinensis]|uniref:uncharacterized protein LOC121052873 n=1 Tax=Rosa chinensis TaxID=74649 RepID=UPI001AD9456F|nr:uncharacterized protein LOC121052873 [Rosa chinensis]
MGIADGTEPCPPCFLSDKEGKLTETVNPCYENWMEKDQMVLGWINGSLTPTVLSTVARSTSSAATWDSLATRYASKSHNRILQLRSDLLCTVRGNLSISDFLDKINAIVDNLALVGDAVSDNDLVSIIMNNVGPLYETTVSSAQARDTPITYDSLEALLLNAERRYAEHSLPSLDLGGQASALHASRSRGRGRSGPSSLIGPGCGGSYGSRGNSFVSRGSSLLGRGLPSSRGTNNNFGQRGSSSLLGPAPTAPASNTGHSIFHSGSRIHCQICGRPGHSALDYYNRMNMAFEGRVPSSRLTAMAASNTLSSADGVTWLADSGANTHVTPNIGSHNQEDAFPREE